MICPQLLQFARTSDKNGGTIIEVLGYLRSFIKLLDHWQETSVRGAVAGAIASSHPHSDPRTISGNSSPLGRWGLAFGRRGRRLGLGCRVSLPIDKDGEDICYMVYGYS